MQTTITAKLAEITATVTDVTTATPSEIDTVLAGTYGLATQYRQYLDGAVQSVRWAIGQRGIVRRGWTEWPTTEREAIEIARTRAADPTAYGVCEALAKLDKYMAALDEIAAAETPFAARYAAEQWNRYFWTQSNGGHGHRSMNCSTCNKNGKATAFGWHPELSGLTDADAIAKFGTSVCSVCFPDAPVAVKTDALKPGQCLGSRQKPVAGTEMRTWQGTSYGRCAGCPADEDLRVMTAAGVVKAHAAKKK